MCCSSQSPASYLSPLQSTGVPRIIRSWWQLSRSSGPLRQDSVAALEANRAMFARLRRKAFGQLAQWDAWLCAQVLWESASMEVPFSAAD